MVLVVVIMNYVNNYYLLSCSFKVCQRNCTRGKVNFRFFFLKRTVPLILLPRGGANLSKMKHACEKPLRREVQARLRARENVAF